MIKEYIKKIFEEARQGDAREESYYSALEGFLEEFAVSINKKNIRVTTLPKKTEAGNPDFRVWDGKQKIAGYIEAKRPAQDNLDNIEESEQLKRYLNTFPNLILTNFFEFRLYRGGQLIDKVRIAKPFLLNQIKTAPPPENEEEFVKLLEKFFSFSLPKTYTGKTLAIELAKRTRFLKEEVVAEELQQEAEKKQGFLLGFYEAFKKYLIGGLDTDDFADLYSQTIAYGLFAARTRCENGFNRTSAVNYIPESIGILREMFQFISLGKLPPAMEWIIDDISEVLATADVKQILHRFYAEGKGADPVIHFYETFLAEYDPKERERRGVYYTPVPVVSYIVRSLDAMLKERFGKSAGFASEGVTVLDPACGTGTFIAETVKSAVESFTAKYGSGGKRDFIKSHILNNFYGFELMMAPYAVGHLKLSFLMEELDCPMEKDERFKLYLTNTLEMEEPEETFLPGMVSLTKESHLAGEVKNRTPILVILGNPPYSGISSNKGKWITNLIEDYKYVDGAHFKERKHWLQDDYVKFIRFAQWKIEQEGEGILGFITNHSYLDNPTFRGMRQFLMSTFNEIYLLDLHGNSLKKEVCPDGGKDENVFDIRQGVAIAILVKNKGVKGCAVYHSELWGLREEKYKELLEKNIEITRLEKLTPTSPYYFFVPREEKDRVDYEKYWKTTDIFPVNATGIVTARDRFVIDFDKDALRRRIEMFRNPSISDEIIQQTFKLKDTRGWKLTEARRALLKDTNWNSSFAEILYRPFDIRYIYYTQTMVDWSRLEVMRHMLKENLGLITVRQVAEGIFNHVLVSSSTIDNRITASNKGIAYLFPLYLYPEEGTGGKTPNISQELVRSLAETYGKQVSPEEIFYYIYGVLYSDTYRKKYAEFLKIDFPRIPFTKDHTLFLKIGELGKQLVDLHLLKSPETAGAGAKFEGEGDGRVEKPVYKEKEKRVYINGTQYFEGIEKKVWSYQVGGYQVMDKWLKDRKGTTLTHKDIVHYCNISSALQQTIDLQKSLDILYKQIGSLYALGSKERGVR
jgi:hypothetical protein